MNKQPTSPTPLETIRLKMCRVCLRTFTDPLLVRCPACKLVLYDARVFLRRDRDPRAPLF